MRITLMAVLLLGASQVAAQPYAYVPNQGSNNVSVIDDATLSVAATIPAGSTPSGVSVSADGSRVYIANLSSNNVTVIDGTTNTVVTTVAVGLAPYGLVVSPDGSEVYVPNSGGNSVSVIDTATNTVVATIPGLNNPWYPDVTPDGAILLVPNHATNTVSAIDTATRTIVQTYVVQTAPVSVSVTPNGSKAYVTNDNGNIASAIDLGTGIVTALPGTGSTIGVDFLPDSSMAYFASWNSGNIYRIDTATDTIVQTIVTDPSMIGASITPDGARLYVANRNQARVDIIDTATNAVIGSVPVGISPWADGNMFQRAPYVAPIAQGVQLDAVPGAPVVYAEEIIASPGSPVTLLNPAGDLNLSANLGYSFSIGEVRYARFECDNGLEFDAGSTAVYDGAGSAGLGAINGLGNSAMHFSITANDNNVTASDRLVITGDRQITGTTDVNCTYSLYDFPSQAAAGGPNGRVYSVSGPYIRFAPSYALEVDAEGNPVANVESNDPAYSEFTNATPTNDVLLGNIGGFTYGEVQDVTGAVQPLTPAGPAITLADLMDADTALIFAGDFSAASDVFFSPNADCSVNIQSADDFSGIEAVFTIGSNPTLAHQLCFATDGVAIPVSEYTVALDAVPAAPTVYAVTDLGPLDLGVITRNGTELQAPLAQIPGGWLSRLVLTNTGSQDRSYEITVMGETGTVISTDNLTGIVEAQSTLVVDLDTVLTGFTGGLPRATLNVTVAAPNRTIQGLYQIVNPDSGSISNHVMVRPGTN